MFDDSMTDDEVLSEAKVLFEETLDFYEAFFEEARDAFDFRDGHQWSAEDLEILEEQGRPALTFNVVKPRMNHLIGAHEDSRMTPRATPLGGEDQFAADVLNTLIDRVRQKSRADRVDTDVYQDGICCGQGLSTLDVYEDPSNPAWIKISEPKIDPLEVKWDPASFEKDRHDARYLFWDRWLSKSEFKIEFPDLRDQIDEIMDMADDHGQRRYSSTPMRTGLPRPDTYRRSSDLLYYDRRKNMIRIIHMEYKQAFRRLFVINAESGRLREIPPEIEQDVADLFPRVEFTEVWDERFMTLEFIGDLIVDHGQTQVPYDGFTVDVFTCYIDYQTGLPFGIMRDLIDPQREVNKRHSQTLHQVTAQTQPGTFAEVNAVTDQDEFEESLTEAGSTTWLNSGGLDKVRERKVPDVPEATARLFDISMQLVNIISGVHNDELMTPRGIPEAAATAQLKHRERSLATIPIKNPFQAYQEARRMKEIQVVMRAMPDDQIEALLGNSKKYRVERGVVYDLEQGFEMDVRDIRNVEFDVELEFTDADNSQKMMELNVVIEMQKANMPIDPEVIIDLTSLSSDRKARLKAYVKQIQEASSQGEQMKAQSLMDQLRQQAEIDLGKLRVQAADSKEKTRHNLVTEMITAMKASGDYDTKLLEIWEKSDDTEKRMLTQIFQAVMARQAARSQRPAA